MINNLKYYYLERVFNIFENSEEIIIFLMVKNSTFRNYLLDEVIDMLKFKYLVD